MGGTLPLCYCVLWREAFPAIRPHWSVLISVSSIQHNRFNNTFNTFLLQSSYPEEVAKLLSEAHLSTCLLDSLPSQLRQPLSCSILAKNKEKHTAPGKIRCRMDHRCRPRLTTVEDEQDKELVAHWNSKLSRCHLYCQKRVRQIQAMVDVSQAIACLFTTIALTKQAS